MKTTGENRDKHTLLSDEFEQLTVLLAQLINSMTPRFITTSTALVLDDDGWKTCLSISERFR
ncbi:hypothetical protein [Dickeya sp. CFBP 2040]|uniref:hypothetical protein n=1 Tax=Dickeya sp. CFBP 2040 TaxID=2718531 RepID=UPI001446E4B4|nr:hypothetical protein [Dickeya sp. CFBP 2040]